MALLSIFSLGTINLLGFPADIREQSLEVEVEIWNNKKEIIKRYTANVLDSEYVAAYYGYNGNTIYRKLAADNIKHALEQIRKQINDDAEDIKKNLK